MAAKKKARKATKKKTAKKKATKKKTARKAKTRKKAAKKTTRKKATKRKAAKKTTRKKAKKKPARKKTARKPAKKKARKKPARKKARKKAGGAFMRPVQPDSALAAVVGGTPIPRSTVVKKLWGYIKRHGLQDDVNRRMINADDKLKVVFGGKKQVNMFQMTKLVSKHLS